MKKEKQFRTALNLIMLFVLVVAAPVLVSGQETEPEGERSGASGGCNDLTGKWITKTSDGSITWEFKQTKASASSYHAWEISPGKHRGIADLLQGNKLRIEYSSGRNAFLYSCKLDENCQSSLSPCKLYTGRLGADSPDATYEATIERQQ